MADTVVSDAAVFPQDEGLPNITDGSESWGSAGHLSLLATATANGPFHYDGLGFTAHDATNDTVDVAAGISVLDLGTTSVSTQSGLGGSSPPAYDTALSRAGALVVELPTATTLSMTASALNPVWIAYATDGTVTGVAAGDVYFRHGSAETAPPHPNIKLGETNPDDSTQDIRAGYDNPPDKDGWREDPNSSWFASGPAGANIVTLDLAGRYDEVLLDISAWNTSANTVDINLRINGDSTLNYSWYSYGGSETTGYDMWPDLLTIAAGSTTDRRHLGNCVVWLRGRWPGTGGEQEPSVAVRQSTQTQSGGGVDQMMSGKHVGAVASPLESVDIRCANTIDWGYEIHAFGRQRGYTI